MTCAANSDRIIEILPNINLDDLDSVIDHVGNLLSPFDRQELEEHWHDRYEPPPIEGNANIIALRSYQALFLESHQQHNCAASFHSDVDTGEYAIFGILAPERATLGLTFNQEKQCYQIDQLVLRDNQLVASSTRRLIKQWLHQANQFLTA